MYIDRQMQSLLTELQTQFPALLVTGPRQVGKSTLLKHVAPDHHYVSFDDPLLRQQADDDPALFLRNHPDRLILDEVQHVPSLFPLLKLEIDRRQENGRYLLSGSQAFGLMQNVSESLAGRIAVARLATPGHAVRSQHLASRPAGQRGRPQRQAALQPGTPPNPVLSGNIHTHSHPPPRRKHQPAL